MKVERISFLILLILIVAMVGLSLPKNEYRQEYLRIHVRANSSSDVDQAVKYKVKDKVVEVLTPLLVSCNTKKKAVETLTANEDRIEQVANKVLEENGFLYKANAKIKNELFPTRVYENYTLEKGYYDALIINLGNGEGENWWCVVYPPLCFTGDGSGYIYKSKIRQIINEFYERQTKEDR